jgi:hypothetical protein
MGIAYQDPPYHPNYVNEISENNAILGQFSPDVKRGLKTNTRDYCQITKTLEARLHKIDLCQNGKVIHSVMVHPKKVREVLIYDDPCACFFEGPGGLMLKPITTSLTIITFPLWFPFYYLSERG